MYAPHHDREAISRTEIMRDLPYGPDVNHRVDVFRPKPGGKQVSRAVIYLHSGGFHRGDKSDEENIAIFLADSGCIVFSANYRLAPEHTWPAGIEDMQRLLAWTEKAKVDYGARDTLNFLMGYSAGAGHAAGFAFSEVASHAPAELSGLILLSGPC